MILALAGLLFWGVLNQQIWIAAGMGMIWVIIHKMPWRWQMTVTQFYRFGDLISLLFIGFLLYLIFGQSEQRPVYALLEWLPLFYWPLMLIQLAGVQQQIPVGTLLYSVRRSSQIYWLDFSVPYTAITLLSAGTSLPDGWSYFGGCGVFIIALLWQQRSKTTSLFVWLLLIVTAIAAGLGTQKSLRQMQNLMEQAAMDWFMNRHTDPFQSMTHIGAVGELKLSSGVLFRVKGDEPLLLMQAAYDRYAGKNWFATQRQFEPLLLQTAKGLKVKQAEFFQSPASSEILALPPGLRFIEGLEGAILQTTALGTVKLTEAPDYIHYRVGYDGQRLAPEGLFDLEIPEPHSDWIQTLREQLHLENQPPAVIAEQIAGFFQSHYFYTLYTPSSEHADQALKTFALQRKAGHCEYFAVATVFLLRSYGIPARLATGYAMQEYDPDSGLYLIRHRHAHAWALAYIDGHWQDVDSTPARWLTIEEQQDGIFQPIQDWFSMWYFQFRQWRFEQASEKSDGLQLKLTVAALLSVYLLWRLFKGRKNLIRRRFSSTIPTDYPGMDSEFYKIIDQLNQTHAPRSLNEPLAVWLKRIGQPDLLELLIWHYRYRFSATPEASAIQKHLQQAVAEWLKHQPK